MALLLASPVWREGGSVAHLIAAYAIVIAALAAYGWRVQGQRRQLMRRVPPDERRERET